MKKNHIGWIILAIIAVIVILFTALTYFFTDWLWFKELDYVSVFFKQLLTELAFGIPTFLVLTVICYFYLLAMKKGYYKQINNYDTETSEKKLNRITLLISAAFGLFAAIPIARDLWFQLLQFINSTDFNIADPIFGQDVSFYIFQLDFITSINSFLIWILIGFAAINLLYYVVLLSMRRPDFMDDSYAQPLDEAERRREQEKHRRQRQNQNPFGGNNPLGDLFGQMFGTNQRPNESNPYEGMNDDDEEAGKTTGSTPPPSSSQPLALNRHTMERLLSIASRQFKVIGVLFFLMLAIHFFLKQYTLLYTSSSGVVYGAGFSNITITLWMYRIMIALSLISAVLFIIALNKHRLKTFLAIPISMVGVLLLGGIGTILVQNLVVAPDEINKESQYLQNNIEFTRYAYDLQDIDVQGFSADNTLTAEDIINNNETISNIRINDYEPALKFYNQTQSIRLYYKFTDVDVDRYTVNDEYTQVFLSARELDETATTNQWLSNHIKYTHGYGVTLSRVDKVTASGQPDMLIDSIPPISDVPEIEITRPEIYFGENTNNYILLNTDEQEFDYPSGENNVYCDYEGTAGIRMNLINRLLFAIRERSLKLLVSTNLDSDSRIVINRNIMERVQTIAPFLSYDSDPYIVTVSGKLYWILDAYTTSSYYPYSEPYSDESTVNYIRNSVKVIIDAYNGDTNFYIVDSNDPIAITLQKIYPKLFRNYEEMPEELQAHLRYPNTMFSIQAKVYAKYHMTDINVFYQNEDGWDIATEIYGTDEVQMAPTYYIMKLPGEENAEFITSIPYTPSTKNNMTALLVARSDGDAYGDLVLYQLPKDKIYYGPRQIEAQINQHTEIAQDFTLWSSAGSTYTRGNMFVIPIENSLMYVEPIYLESANSSLPEVKRVIIYYNERIAYEKTLAEALDSMFGEGTSEGYVETVGATEGSEDDEDDDKPTIEELANLANEAFNNATAAQRDGDWTAYGKYINEVADYLNQMMALTGDVTATDTTNMTDAAIPE